MLLNHLKFTLRILWRNKFYSILNILGLALGIACSILILLYVQNELSYDLNHENYEQIYRVNSIFKIRDSEDRFALSARRFPELAKEEFPEVEAFVRFRFAPEILLRHGDKQFYEASICFVDSNVFDVFTYEFVAGSAAGSLSGTTSMILTESMAEKYFGSEDPIGKTLSSDIREYIVTGVIKDLPDNNHMQFEALIPFAILDRFWPLPPNEVNEDLWSVSNFSYLKMAKGFRTEQFDEKYPDFYEKYLANVGDQIKSTLVIRLQPLASIHFDQSLEYDLPTGNKSYVYAFGLIGLSILLLACINYMNMATARSANRAREIGMRKVSGSSSWQLIGQFLGESIIMSFFSLILALAVVEIVLEFTAFNNLIGKGLTLDFLGNYILLLGSLAIALLVGLLSGMYPAFYLSSIKPLSALKSSFKTGTGNLILRRGLVAFQFMISIGVVISTLLMTDQIDYIRNKELGFNKDNMLLMTIRDTNVSNRMDAIKHELLTHPNILAAEVSNNIPALEVGKMIFTVETVEGMQERTFNLMAVGFDYLKTMEMEILEGRDFDKKRGTDQMQAFVVNERAVEFMGWDKAIGKRITWGGNSRRTGEVIGVVKDFNTHTLHENIEPLVMFAQANNRGTLHIRIKGTGIPETLKFLEDKWVEYDPKHPFDYRFLDSSFAELYEADERQSKLIGILAYICMAISCLGLFGLASFSTQQRTKEIGIRKVLGASRTQVVALVVRDIMILVLIASVIASPLAYYAFKRWLENFAFQVEVDAMVFVLAALLALVISFLTVSYHSFRAASSDPVNAIKYE